jgi:hypothetical protein
MIRGRVLAGLARFLAEDRRLDRPTAGDNTEDAIRARLATEDGVLKVAKALCVGVSTVPEGEGRDALTAIRVTIHVVGAYLVR